MTKIVVDLKGMSQAELDAYLDRLVSEGQEDTPEFHRAYRQWEKLNGQ